MLLNMNEYSVGILVDNLAHGLSGTMSGLAVDTNQLRRLTGVGGLQELRHT